jgi:hypothetical protein
MRATEVMSLVFPVAALGVLGWYGRRPRSSVATVGVCAIGLVWGAGLPIWNEYFDKGWWNR